MKLKDRAKRKIAEWQKKKEYDKKIAELKKRDPFVYKNF